MPITENSYRFRHARPRVAIVGATGAVGQELLSILAERDFPVGELRLLASPRSAGRVLTFRDHDIGVEILGEQSFAGIDLALFSAGSGTAREWAPVAVRHGAIVVDNSSAFRMNPAVPLVVPEINGTEIARHDGILAVPNCAAIIAITPLWPIHRRNRIRRLILSTYQAASGAGAAAMDELVASTRAYLAGEPFAPRVLPHPYAFNLFSHDTKIDPSTGYNEEETKVINETRKIFGEPELRVGVTCIRVPVLRAHAVSVTLECDRPISPEEARALIADAPGCRLVNDPERNHFPMPLEATGQDDILVGRIRRDLSDPSGRSLSLFVTGDQLRKGAALNAVQIAERLLP
ncbi:MAG TPA: aspartate-semialdehyde dehydrogenase [Stellaceae bacterium]|nr:aspartate-semialdehyde dehydrogenase [Stellaceae bacterium]